MNRQRVRAGDLVSIDIRTDAELTASASRGDTPAFEELYRRHAEAAWRVAMAVTRNRDDAADAVSDAFTRVFQALPKGRLDGDVPFRPYLLSATRNAAVDVLRRAGRLSPTDDMEDLSAPVTTGPSDRVVMTEDAALVAQAFSSLPERWRSVLWLTEVEGVPAREVAQRLGLTANGAAQLAVRARAGLRHRYLQAHVRSAPERKECRFTIEHLGAYVGGGLAARDIAKVDQHLAACEPCTARKDELDDLGSTLRRIIVPLPVGLAVLAAGKWRLAMGIAEEATRRGGGILSRFDATRRVVAGSAAGLVTLALLTLTHGSDHADSSTAPSREPRIAAPRHIDRPATVEGMTLEAPTPVAFESTAPAADTAPVAAEAAPAVASEAPQTAPFVLPEGGSTRVTEDPQPAAAPAAAAPAAQAPAKPQVQVGAGVASGGQTTVISVGLGEGACTGVVLAGVPIGCTPTPAPAEDAVSAGVDGQQVPTQVVTIPLPNLP